MKIDNNRYINEAALLADLERYANQVDTTGTLTCMLKHIVFNQHDRVYLVRCKDCAHGKCKHQDMYLCFKDGADVLPDYHDPNWFCADGEPRT